MAKKVTVVVSQGQSNNPARRKLEEDLVAGLLFERGLEVTVVPHLYDLAPDGTGMLCLQSISGDMIVLSWLFPRAAHWILDRNGIRGRTGATLLVNEGQDDDDDEDEDAGDEERASAAVEESRPAPNRDIYCLDLRVRDEAAAYIEEVRRIVAEASVETVSVDLMGWIQGTPKPEQLARYLDPAAGQRDEAILENRAGQPAGDPSGANGQAAAGNNRPGGEGTAIPAQDGAVVQRIDEEPQRRWYPVIDYSRCTNCLECLDFCLFGVYGVGGAETILVEQPDNCRKGCPACSRVCPANAIIFPQHKTPAIAGSADGTAGGLKIDLSKLFGAPDALEVAVLERDVELVAVGRDAVGAMVGMPKRQAGGQQGPKDDLDNLIDSLDELEL
ncbi:MAG: ferredoxin family protein [Pirellulales bacterium]